MRAIQAYAIAAVAIAGVSLAGCATAPGSVARWQVIRSSDPITGVTSCVVAAPDQAAGMNFTRSFMLYPIVEKNSQRGLLVGVSSGGQVRVPVGQVLWRVDDRPFRELGRSMTEMASDFASGTRSAAEMARMQQAMIDEATAYSTVAEGPQAMEMLQEMRAGRSLLFRQKQAAASYGLPGTGASAVGQYSATGGHEAIPIDASFAEGLRQCGIE